MGHTVFAFQRRTIESRKSPRIIRIASMLFSFHLYCLILCIILLQDYNAVAVVGLGKRGAGFDAAELLHQGREQVRVAAGGKSSLGRSAILSTITMFVFSRSTRFEERGN